MVEAAGSSVEAIEARVEAVVVRHAQWTTKSPILHPLNWHPFGCGDL